MKKLIKLLGLITYSDCSKQDMNTLHDYLRSKGIYISINAEHENILKACWSGDQIDLDKLEEDFGPMAYEYDIKSDPDGIVFHQKEDELIYSDYYDALNGAFDKLAEMPEFILKQIGK